MYWQSMLVDLAGLESGGVPAYPADVGFVMILGDHLWMILVSHRDLAVRNACTRDLPTYGRTDRGSIRPIFYRERKVPLAPKCAKFCRRFGQQNAKCLAARVPFGTSWRMIQFAVQKQSEHSWPVTVQLIAGTRKRLLFPTWQRAYEAALLATDIHALFKLVEIAESALLVRRDLLKTRSKGKAEQRAIEDALRILSAIKEERLMFPSTLSQKSALVH